MRVIGYVRVSTDEQATEGVSLDAQREKVRLFAEMHDLDLVETIADAGVSAGTLDRPGLARALALLNSGSVNGLVVFKLDRLTRDLGDWSALIDDHFGDKAGQSLMSVSESIDTRTATGRMVLNMIMTVAQWERETIVERTRGAMAFKRSRGERLGQVPYGKRLADDLKTLVDDFGEQCALEEIRRLRSEGASSRAIARYLDGQGYPTKNGGPLWAHSTIATILERERETTHHGDATARHA